jgi:hypothetical protein|tara:strand:+ start:21 stop:302 length:282 start_codon:yes stop_codon:yes gene_type:complete
MKVNFKLKGNTYSAEFKVLPSIKAGGIICMAKTSNDLDVLQDIIIASNEALLIPKALQGYLESKLKLPIDIDYDYNGAGYGFKIDTYSLVKKL